MTDTPPTEPLHCPFCGGEAECREVSHQPVFWILCMNEGCNAGTKYYALASEAISAWNHRHTPPEVGELKAENEKLTAIVRHCERRYNDVWEYCPQCRGVNQADKGHDCGVPDSTALAANGGG